MEKLPGELSKVLVGGFVQGTITSVGYIFEGIHQAILEYAAANEAVCMRRGALILDYVSQKVGWQDAQYENVRGHLNQLWDIGNLVEYVGSNGDGDWFVITEAGRQQLREG